MLRRRTLSTAFGFFLPASILAACGNDMSGQNEGGLASSTATLPSHVVRLPATKPQTGAISAPTVVPSASEMERMANYVNTRIDRTKVRNTLQTKEGRHVDCFDLNAQSALRGGSVAQPPAIDLSRQIGTSPPRGTSAAIPEPLFSSGGTEARCAPGTVPIPDVTLNDVSRFATLDDFFKKERGETNPASKFSGPALLPIAGSYVHQYGIGRSDVTNWGAFMYINNWAPYVARSDEFSLGQLWVVGNGPNGTETLETGFQTFPDLYGDSASHLFIYSTRDSYQQTVHPGCYNNTCGDFVQYSTIFWPTVSVSTSVVFGAQYSTPVAWYKDGPTGPWWLNAFGEWIGYYPQSLFVAIASQAARIDFGGEIVYWQLGASPHTDTDMGSGSFSGGGFGLSAWMSSAVSYNAFGYGAITPLSISTWGTNPTCYDVWGGTSGSDTFIYYGGPGRNAQCP